MILADLMNTLVGWAIFLAVVALMGYKQKLTEDKIVNIKADLQDALRRANVAEEALERMKAEDGKK